MQEHLPFNVYFYFHFNFKTKRVESDFFKNTDLKQFQINRNLLVVDAETY